MAPKLTHFLVLVVPFSTFFTGIDSSMHFGRPLAHFWHPFAPLWRRLAPFWHPMANFWRPFPFFLATFGGNLVPLSLFVSVGSLLAPFRLDFDPFDDTLSIFMIVYPSPSNCFEIVIKNLLQNKISQCWILLAIGLFRYHVFFCVRLHKTPAHDRQHHPQLVFFILISLYRFYTNFVRGAPHTLAVEHPNA